MSMYSRTKTIKIDTDLDDEELTKIVKGAIGCKYNDCMNIIKDLDKQIKSRQGAGVAANSMIDSRCRYEEEANAIMRMSDITVVTDDAAKMKVGTVLELSNAHFTGKDNEVLGEMGHNPVDEPLNIGNMQYGYCIVIPEEKEFLDESIEECKRLGYELSEDFFNVLRYAHENQHRVIVFDRDADVLDDLPTHDDW